MQQPKPEHEEADLIASIEALGVEVKDAVATEWIQDMRDMGQATGLELGEHGVFGHRSVLIDFAAEDVERYRKLAEVVGIPSRPDVDTAIALAGSSAQSRAQLFPGDCDLFERINIHAETREEAVDKLTDLILENVQAVMQHENFQLTEVKLGAYPETLERQGEAFKAGTPISWLHEDLVVRQIEARRPDGDVLGISLTAAASQPGFTKLDWVVADAQTGQVLNTSKMLDITWEAPDGHIEPLDGAIDPYYQEVYLREENLGTVRRLIDHLSPDSLREYLGDLEAEVERYTFGPKPNYGKVAKRLYNIFRVLGRYEEALYLRELFDEPAARLYQVAAVLDAIGRDLSDGRAMDAEVLHTQVVGMEAAVQLTIGGEDRENMLALLGQLRSAVEGECNLEGCERVIEDARALALDTVNLFFQGHLVGNPQIWSYVEGLRK